MSFPPSLQFPTPEVATLCSNCVTMNLICQKILVEFLQQENPCILNFGKYCLIIFQKKLVLVYSPISNVWESLSSHNFTNTVYYHRFPSTCFQVFISAQLISENLLKPFLFPFLSISFGNIFFFLIYKSSLYIKEMSLENSMLFEK